ncbi:MAG: SEC-C metal-binding domain-containing protein [Saprospiraceae bacterium]
MLNIRYSQLIYPDAIEDVLGGSSLEVKDPVLAAQLAKLPHYHYDKVMRQESLVKFKRELKKATLLFPNFFWFRILNSLDNVDRENPAFFYKMYGEEMACTEDGFHLPYLMYDDDFEGWIKFVASFYEENGMQDKLVSLYLNLEDTSFSMAKFEVAAALLGDNSEYNPFLHEIDESSYQWLDECLDHPILENVDNRPVHDILYSILNVNLSKTIVPIALELDQTNFGEKEITSAIKWLLKQGLFRAIRNDSLINLDFFIHAFYLTVAYKLRELYPFFIDRLICTNDEINDYLSGDYAHEFLGPAFQTLFDDELSSSTFESLKKGGDDFWYNKSILLTSLGSLVKHRDLEHPGHQFLKDLFNSYINDGVKEMTNWCFYPIYDYGLTGFEEEFERAYASGLIEKEIFGTKECILTNSEFSKPFPLLTTFSSLLEHSLNSLREETPVADPIQRAKVYMETFRESDDENDDFDYEPDYDASIIPMFGNEPIVNSSPKIGRNDPCPCGSGKKYKKCCGKGG